MKKWRLVVDTNLIVSALLFEGITSQLMKHFESETIRLVISKEILEEYVRALSYPKFSLEEDEITFLISEYIIKYAETITPKKIDITGSLDRDDDKFIECAVAGKVDALLSGDKHLLKLREFEKIPILTFQAFIKSHLDLNA